MKSCCKEYMQEEPPKKESWWQRLANRWQVKSLFQVVLILVTFALGGSTCAYIGGKILPLLGLEGIARGLVYVLLVTILWPICVLIISIPLGQFAFFKKYLAKMGKRILGKSSRVSNTESNVG